MVKYTLDTNIFIYTLYMKKANLIFYKWVNNKDSIIILSVLNEINSLIRCEMSSFFYFLINSLKKGKNPKEIYNSEIGLKFKKKFPNISINFENLEDINKIINKAEDHLNKIRTLNAFIVWGKEYFPLTDSDINVILDKQDIKDKKEKLMTIKDISENFHKDVVHILLCEEYGDRKKTDVWFICEDETDLISKRENIKKYLDYVEIKSMNEW